MVRKWFPLSCRLQRDFSRLLLAILFYVALAASAMLLASLFSWIPLIGILFHVFRWLAGLYCGIGFILAWVSFFGWIR